MGGVGSTYFMLLSCREFPERFGWEIDEIVLTNERMKINKGD